MQRSLCFLSIALYFLLYLFFLPFLMIDGDSVTINNLCNSDNGTFVTLDDYLSLTGYEPNAMELTVATELNDTVSSDINFQDSLDYTAPSSDLYMDDDALGKLLAEAHRDYADYRRAEGVSVSLSSMSVMVDRTGEPVERSDSNHFPCSVRNVKSAQNQFPVITQAKRMVDRTDQPPASSTCTPMQMSNAMFFTKQTRIALILNESVFFKLARQMFLPTSRRCSETRHGTLQTTRLPSVRIFGVQQSGLCVQLFTFTDFSVEKSLCSLPQNLCVPDHVCRDTLPRAYGCPVLLLSLQSNLHRCEVLRSLSQCSWISTLSEFSSCLPSGRHDVCSSTQLVLVHLFEDFHAHQEIKLFLTSLLLGRRCHVLVSLEKTFRRRLRR